MRNLTIITNSVRFIDFCPRLVQRQTVAKVIVSAARSRGPDTNYERQWLDGELEIEMLPQGVRERMRAGGHPGFLHADGCWNRPRREQEERMFDGRPVSWRRQSRRTSRLSGISGSVGQSAISWHAGEFRSRNGDGGALHRGRNQRRQ